MVVGVMGFSGSGKSTFCNELEKMGAYIIDADQIGKDILKKGSEALEKAVALFGEGILLPDGNLNRKKLGDIVFADEKKLALLNTVTLEAIEREIEKRVLASAYEVTVIDCAMLFKMKAYKLCHEVIFIEAPKDVLIKRIIERDSISYETAKNRIERQEEAFIGNATQTVINNDLVELKNKAKALMKGWLK